MICAAQKNRLSLLYSVAASLNLASQIAWGVVLDWKGPRFTCSTAIGLVMVGFAAIAIGTSHVLTLQSTTAAGILVFAGQPASQPATQPPSHPASQPARELRANVVLKLKVRLTVRVIVEFAGVCLMSGSGSGVQISLFHLSELFPARKSTILAIVSGAFQLSFVVFMGIGKFIDITQLSLSDGFAIYLLPLTVALVCSIGIWPDAPVEGFELDSTDNPQGDFGSRCHKHQHISFTNHIHAPALLHLLHLESQLQTHDASRNETSVRSSGSDLHQIQPTLESIFGEIPESGQAAPNIKRLQTQVTDTTPLLALSPSTFSPSNLLCQEPISYGATRQRAKLPGHSQHSPSSSGSQPDDRVSALPQSRSSPHLDLDRKLRGIDAIETPAIAVAISLADSNSSSLSAPASSSSCSALSASCPAPCLPSSVAGESGSVIGGSSSSSRSSPSLSLLRAAHRVALSEPNLRGRALRAHSLVSQLLSPSFVAVLIWLTASLFWLQFFLGTLVERLYELTHESPALTSYYTDLFTLLLPVGVTAIPLFGWLTDRAGFTASIATTSSLGIAFALSCFFESTHYAWAIFLLYSFTRSFLFSSMFAYLAHEFGYRYFGLLSGIVLATSGIVSLAQIQIITINENNRSTLQPDSDPVHEKNAGDGDNDDNGDRRWSWEGSESRSHLFYTSNIAQLLTMCLSLLFALFTHYKQKQRKARLKQTHSIEEEILIRWEHQQQRQKEPTERHSPHDQ